MLEAPEAWKAAGLPQNPAPAAAKRRADPEPGQRSLRWYEPFRSARFRIALLFIAILALAATAGMLALREVLLLRLKDRTGDSLSQGLEELRRSTAVARDRIAGAPSEADVRAAFDAYLAHNVPSDEEGFAFFIGGRPYRSVLRRYPLRRVPSGVLARWAALSRPRLGGADRASGEFATAKGDAFYRAERLEWGPQATGAFAVTSLPSAEAGEIERLQAYGLAVALGALLIGCSLAWLAAGRALAPLRALTETARSISESDLTRRIPLRKGSREGAEMARSFNSMLDRLEASFDSQRRFASDASHELRAPLTVAIGLLSVVDDDRAKRERTVRIVTAECRRMAHIVEDLRLLACAELPTFLRLEEFELGELTYELAAKVAVLGPRRWRLDACATGTVVADRERLTQAVMNLAHNAFEHTSELDTIALGSELASDRARLWVRDTGVGVKDADRERIFVRFARGAGAHRRYRGAGLGLSIVAVIAEAHGGDVALEDTSGGGATFAIAVPRRPAGASEQA